MKRITKAIIPAAGLGTRMLPISHAVPKEMLPIVDIPAIYYLVREAVESGITDILIITNRDKEAMESFFDLSVEYEVALLSKGKGDLVKMLREIADMANVYFLRQKETKGLAHAVGRARSFFSDEPLVVIYGVDVIFSETPVCRQLIDVYEKYGKPVAAVKPVSPELLTKYCSLKVAPTEDRGVYLCDDMIEKPKPGEEFSNLAILGRVLLTPDVFDVIEALTPGAGGEYQLTDAMAKMARERGFTAIEFEGERYDLGSKLGFLKANTVMGLSHPETKDEYKRFLKELLKESD
ncbi:MAG: UTP--glucose-1-phosphate uridylyltransferase [Clostridia bacterium]|nr:UTP--glucose-1-phosphate uridylyltransferase [Clostridia bacterium]